MSHRIRFIPGCAGVVILRTSLPPESKICISTGFAGADFSAAKLVRARLRECRFTGARADSADFSLVSAPNSDFGGVEFQSVKFYQADLARGNFFRAKLVDCNFSESVLSFADFSSSSLENSRFGGANLTTANLTGAILSGARELTGQQLGAARTAADTTLPNGVRGPYRKGSGSERPLVRPLIRFHSE